MLEHLNMQTPDGVETNIEKIAALFPSAVTEMRAEDGTMKKGINFEALKQLLSHDIVDGKEHYEFTWVGKKQAMAEAARPTTQTLRPVKADSRNWDTTENLYLEGDNLEVLKILQQSYLGKVKMIYIDPPYNTGSDFIYKDDRTHSQQEENERMGMYDENDNRLFKNTDSNGKFHSDWCSMMYARLSVARNLLTPDGVIFISIDDNEIGNLRKICDRIFGEQNFINCIAVKMSEASGVKMNHAKTRFPKLKEYLLFYKKQEFDGFVTIDKYQIEKWDEENNLFLENFSIQDRNQLRKLEEKEHNNTSDVELANNILKNVKIVSLAEKLKERAEDTTEWLFDNSYRIIKTAGSSSLATLVKKQRVVYNQDIAATISNSGTLYFYITKFNSETKQPRIQVIFSDSNIYKNPCDFWQDIKTTGAIAGEGGVNYNNGKKPLKLLNRIVKMTTTSDDIVMDFFSGSASTAHSVMQMNYETKSKRRYIMVQIDENLDKSLQEADGVVKKTIKETIDFLDEIKKPHLLSELGKERIRRAGDKIKAEHPDADVDIGFRVFKVDSSNMKEVYFHPEEVTQTMLGETVSNIKPDRTDLDLLYDCMLRCGVEIDLPHTTTLVDGCKVHNVDNGALMACFDANVPESVVHAMAAQQPIQAIFRDSSFATDAEKINVTEIFKNLSPDTKVRVI